MKLLSKYVWLLDTLRKAGERGILFDEIARRWEYEYGEELSKRTFHHQKNRIEELFDVNINCDRRTNLYSIEGVNDLQGDGVRNWILDTFALSNTVLGAMSLRERIVIDEKPSSHTYLPMLLTAMKQSNFVKMAYHSFKQENPMILEIAPYFVKEYKNRWYLYGVAKEDKLKLYALDRMLSLEISEEYFTLPDNFSAHDTLYTAFGVTLYDDILPTTITIRAYGDKYKYLDTLPLHHSQRKIGDNTYELYVAPTSEFISEILHQGENIEVVSPEYVRELVTRRLKLINKNYE